MSSDYEDILKETGNTPNEDIGNDILGHRIYNDELLGVQDDLKNDYDLSYDLNMIQALMEEFGLSFGYTTDFRIADIIYEELFIEEEEN